MSGGRILGVETVEQIESAFGEILSELRDQYAVGYYPQPDRDDGSWRDLEVKLRGRGLRVRTRQGYLDY